MKAATSCSLLGLAFAALIFSGCAGSDQYHRMLAAGYDAGGLKKVYGPWRPIPDTKAPVLTRLMTVFSYYPVDQPHDARVYFEVKNVGTGKLQIAGVCSTNRNLRFIDVNQPGAYNMTLYPGESDRAAPDDNIEGDEKTFYISVQDFAVTK